jgi:hypothetical protein
MDFVGLPPPPRYAIVDHHKIYDAGAWQLPGPFCASIGLMTDNHDLHVEVQGDYIIITLPGTKFMVTYYKVGDPPQVMTKSVWTDDPDAPVTLGAFRARAWIAANDKARELGWIV